MIPKLKTFASLGLIVLVSSQAQASTFTLSSPSFDDGAVFPLKQVSNQGDCKGEGKNESPALEWTDGPTGTQSYAVTIYDPDAPSGSGWWHWVLFNIPVTTTSILEGAKKMPIGSIQALNDSGKSQFEGACPPKGNKPHRYVITVYALKTQKIPLDSKSSGAMVGYYIHQNQLAKSSITATYSR